MKPTPMKRIIYFIAFVLFFSAFYNSQAQTFTSMRDYLGSYTGLVNGLPASLEIRQDHKARSRTFIFSLKNKDEKLQYTGVYNVSNLNVREHMISNLELKSANGKVLILNQLFLHTWDINHLSGITSNGEGLVFTKGNLIQIQPKGRRFLNENDWVGIYKGKWDGRDAALLIRKNKSVGWNISIQDSDRNAYFDQDFEKLPFKHSDKKVLLNLRLGQKKNQVIIGEMIVHKWNVNYITGSSISGEKKYGFYFKRR